MENIFFNWQHYVVYKKVELPVRTVKYAILIKITIKNQTEIPSSFSAFKKLIEFKMFLLLPQNDAIICYKPNMWAALLPYNITLT